MLILGLILYFNRTRGGIQVTGTVTGFIKSAKKVSRVEVMTESPIVNYEISGKSYNIPSAKFYTEGTAFFKKGDKIRIKVSKNNHRHFVPSGNGNIIETILITSGGFMILACIYMIFRYY